MEQLETEKDGSLLMAILPRDVWILIVSLTSFRTAHSLQQSCTFFKNLLQRTNYFENYLKMMIEKQIQKIKNNEKRGSVYLIYYFQNLVKEKYCEQHQSFCCRSRIVCQKCKRQSCGYPCEDCFMNKEKCPSCNSVSKDIFDCSCGVKFCNKCYVKCNSCFNCLCRGCCSTVSKNGTSRHCYNCVHDMELCQRCENRYEYPERKHECTGCGEIVCLDCYGDVLIGKSKLCGECVTFTCEILRDRKRKRLEAK